MQWRPSLVPLGCRFIGMRKRKNSSLGEVWPRDTKPYRQPFGAEAARNRNRRRAIEIKKRSIAIALRIVRRRMGIRVQHILQLWRKDVHGRQHNQVESAKGLVYRPPQSLQLPVRADVSSRVHLAVRFN